MDVSTYWSIIVGCTLRGLQYGAGFGILVGTCTCLGIGTAYGVVIGGAEGLLYGFLNGLVMSFLTLRARVNSGSESHGWIRVTATVLTTAAIMFAIHLATVADQDLSLWDLGSNVIYAGPVFLSALLLANRISSSYEYLATDDEDVPTT